MNFWQVIIGVVVFVGVAVLWANAAKGVDRRGRFTDADQDGAPDAKPSEKAATIQLFKDEQARRHPED